MDVFLTVLTQIIMLFILMSVGFFFSSKNIISDKVVNALTRILFDIVTPCIIIDSFQLERSDEMLRQFGIVAIAVGIYFIVAIALSNILRIGCHGKRNEIAVKRLSAIYTNCGFMGFPLLTALSPIIGENGLFFGAVFVLINNLFIFTQGVLLFGSDKKISFKDTLKKLLSPAVLGVTIGFILYVCSVSLPPVILQPISYLGSMNTPLAMITIGAIIQRSDYKHIFKDARVYFPVICKNFLFPAVVLMAYFVFSLNSQALLACLILFSCPTAGNCVIFSGLYGGDTDLASKIFTLSTLSSAVSLPLIVTAASILLF